MPETRGLVRTSATLSSVAGAHEVPTLPSGLLRRTGPGAEQPKRENQRMPDLDALRTRWSHALDGARSPGGPDPAPYADNLLARWQEPQRRYHTLAHLTAVLDHIDVLEECAEQPRPRPPRRLVPRRRLPPRPFRERGTLRPPRRTRPARGRGGGAGRRGRASRPAHRHPRPDRRRPQRPGPLRRRPRDPRLDPRHLRRLHRRRPARSTPSSRTRRSGRAGRPIFVNSSTCHGCSGRRTEGRGSGRSGPGTPGAEPPPRRSHAGHTNPPRKTAK